MRGGTSGLAVAHYREANEQEGSNSVHRVAERRGEAAGRGENIESPLVGGGCKFMIFNFLVMLLSITSYRWAVVASPYRSVCVLNF